MIYLQLFLSFLQIGLFSIGGGYAAMPLIKAQVVELNSWLTLSEFADLVTIAEMTPGPIALNAATFVGQQLCGLPGAVIATMGVALPSLIIVSVMANIYMRYRSGQGMQALLSSIRPVVVALIASAAVSLLKNALWNGASPALRTLSLPSLILTALAFLLLRSKKISPILVMALCGAAGLILYYLGIPV